MSGTVAPHSRVRRVVRRGGSAQVRRIGLTPHLASDYFHRFMRAPWQVGVLIMAALAVIGNLAFAFGYWIAGDVIQNARPGSFLDALFFSLQTMSTVGYGYLHPIGLWANALASFEAFAGLTGFAVAAALLFAKFSRPTAKIIFSDRAVVHERDGQRSLVFRMANGRNNQILEASLHATIFQTAVTKEGEKLRRMLDLKLTRTRTPVFALTWTAVHPIDEDSPLYGRSIEELREFELEIIVAFTGLDDGYGQSIHARHSYVLDEIEWDRRLEDIIARSETGETILDFRKFHLTREA